MIVKKKINNWINRFKKGCVFYDNDYDVYMEMEVIERNLVDHHGNWTVDATRYDKNTNSLRIVTIVHHNKISDNIVIIKEPKITIFDKLIDYIKNLLKKLA